MPERKHWFMLLAPRLYKSGAGQCCLADIALAGFEIALVVAVNRIRVDAAQQRKVIGQELQGHNGWQWAEHFWADGHFQHVRGKLWHAGVWLFSQYNRFCANNLCCFEDVNGALVAVAVWRN